MKTNSSLAFLVPVLTLVWFPACGSSSSSGSSESPSSSSSFSPSKSKSKYITDSYWRNDHHPLLYYDSNYETMTHLDKDIALVYQGKKVPDEAVFIVHGEQIARSKNCEHATINALKKLQEDAKKLGANAIVNLAPKWENESLRVGKNKYFCAGGAVTFGIKWEGDFVKIEKDEAPGKSSASDENASGPAEGSAEDSHPLEEEKEDIIVSITLEGKIVYEGKTVTRDFILGILEEKKKSDPDLKIILKADPKTPYGKVAELSVALSDAGFTNVKVMVDEN